jgi:hypothetical protein
MLQDIHIDLAHARKNVLNESAMAQLAGQIRFLLYRLMGPRAWRQMQNVRITGQRSDLTRFSDVISKEKRYMDAYLKHGLNDTRVLNNRYNLERAVRSFESETGIKWPLK